MLQKAAALAQPSLEPAVSGHGTTWVTVGDLNRRGQIQAIEAAHEKRTQGFAVP